jgi:hypothetical protein
VVSFNGRVFLFAEYVDEEGAAESYSGRDYRVLCMENSCHIHRYDAGAKLDSSKRDFAIPPRQFRRAR